MPSGTPVMVSDFSQSTRPVPVTVETVPTPPGPVSPVTIGAIVGTGMVEPSV